MIQAIVTDIEGTTSSIEFVHKVLFPYADKHMHDYVNQHAYDPDVSPLLASIARQEQIDPADTARIIECLKTWIKEDRKQPELKSIQGMMWREGYEQGAFKGHVYPEVEGVLKDWKAEGIRLYVYSSGSVPAQKLLFGYSEVGDLTPLFDGYFDTAIGGKKETTSYQRIQQHLGIPAQNILFLSDIDEELDAASQAGFQVCQLMREAPLTEAASYPIARNFTEISLKQKN
jgi:enolase-phosphatase E1